MTDPHPEITARYTKRRRRDPRADLDAALASLSGACSPTGKTAHVVSPRQQGKTRRLEEIERARRFIESVTPGEPSAVWLDGRLVYEREDG